MKDIRLDDHFKGLNNLKKGEKVIRTETPFKQNGWIYCVDSKRESYCFKRIKKVNIINLDRVELITYEGGIFTSKEMVHLTQKPLENVGKRLITSTSVEVKLQQNVLLAATSHLIIFWKKLKKSTI